MTSHDTLIHFQPEMITRDWSFYFTYVYSQPNCQRSRSYVFTIAIHIKWFLKDKDGVCDRVKTDIKFSIPK